MQRSTLEFAVHDDITLDELKKVIEVAVGKAGCPSCGLNGFDLHFGVDPAERFRSIIRELEGVVSRVEVVTPAFAVDTLSVDRQ